MDRPQHYFCGLCILTALLHDPNLRHSHNGVSTGALHSQANLVMASTETDTGFREQIDELRRLLDAHFGNGMGLDLFELVATLCAIAQRHLRERGAGEPCTFQPEDFDALMGIRHFDGLQTDWLSVSRTRTGSSLPIPDSTTSQEGGAMKAGVTGSRVPSVKGHSSGRAGVRMIFPRRMV